MDELKVGGIYSRKNQDEKLVYMGLNTIWHQFHLVGEPERVWCEVLESGLGVFEEIEPELTQEIIDQTFIEMSTLWDDTVEASEHKLVSSFIAENKDGWAVQFLSEYQMAKDAVEARGFTMPTLVEGVTIILKDAEDEN